MAKTTTKQQIRVLMADDHAIFRDGLRKLLDGDDEITIVGEAQNGAECIKMLAKLKPDILLLDLRMPEKDGLAVLEEVNFDQIPTRVIVLTAAEDDRDVVRAMRLGARGVVLKDAIVEHLTACIHAVMQGQYWLDGHPVQNLVQVLRDLAAQTAPPPRKTYGLTARELEVVNLITEGCTNKDIAKTFGISEETVKRHLTNIFNKLGVGNRLELALFALNHHLMPESSGQ